MRLSPYSTRILVASAAGMALAVALPMASASASDAPEFQMPFACGEVWEGSTRSGHSPSYYSIDWNRDAYDLGQIVSASASGVVTSVIDLGDESYGLHVVIDHGNGWTSLHAHLLKSFVVVGERVDQGQTIALLGTSGGSSGPHLHYEQRLNKVDQRAVFDGTNFVYNTWLTSRNCGAVPIAGDWNGDRLSDVGVFRRRADIAAFRQRLPDGTVQTATFGLPTDTPVIGDWNGDGKPNLGVWSSPTATFTLQTAAGRQRAIPFGDSNDLPVAGDWNGDGRWDVGTFDPATATFSLRRPGGDVRTRELGSVSSLPIAGDWDGNGRSNVGVYDPSTATFSLALAGGTTKTVVYGTRTSLPVVGSWNNNAVSDLGVWDKATGVFSKRFTATHTETVRFGRRR